MRKEVLTDEQVQLLPLVGRFAKDFFLVGGTAVALHIGHRRSIDFDLFSLGAFNNGDIRRKFVRGAAIERVFVSKTGEFAFIARGVKFTFFHYPFKIPATRTFDQGIRVPSLLDLAAMKAHALGQRAKWKDYVDLYFVMKDYHPLSSIGRRAREVFGREFNEKIFRVQLAYFNDIDYSERVIFMPKQEVSDRTIQRALQAWSVGI